MLDTEDALELDATLEVEGTEEVIWEEEAEEVWELADELGIEDTIEL